MSLAGGGSASFSYDGNGNMTGGHNKTLDYDAFNKPVNISYGGLGIGFSYGADRLRYRQQSAAGVRTYYLDKQMEVVMDGAGSAYRHYLGAYAVLTKHGTLSDPAPALHYLHRDRLGSVATITDGGGALEARGFAPFGEPRDGDWALRTPPLLGRSITDRGFTDHEHLDDIELIHMNGRAYDYRLGRFLSVDPIIQAPGNSQSLNPYSYIMNNPLSGTDPSGYCSAGTRKQGQETATECPSGELSHAPMVGDQAAAAVIDNGTSHASTANPPGLAGGGNHNGALNIDGTGSQLSSGTSPAGSNQGSIEEIVVRGQRVRAGAGGLLRRETLMLAALPAAGAVYVWLRMNTSLDGLRRPTYGAEPVLIPPTAEMAGGSETPSGPSDVENLGGTGSPSGMEPDDETGWTLRSNDSDWRGTGRSHRHAIDAAFGRTGVPRNEFQVTKWGRTIDGKTVPVEYRVLTGQNRGAQVNMDFGHRINGPRTPHVGWQTPGKRISGGGQRGHILLDNVPAGR